MMGPNFSPKRIAIEAAILGGLVVLATVLHARLGEEDYDIVLRGLILLGLPAPWIFVAFYRLRPWRESEIGRALMTVMTTFAVYYSAAVYSIFHGGLQAPVRAILYLVVAYAMWRMVAANLRSHHKAVQRQRDRGQGDAPELASTNHRRSTDL